MLIFGHVGLALATVDVGNLAAGRLQGLGRPRISTKLVDYRLVILGALLPDLVDKPLGFLFPEVVGTTRSIGHTFLFAAVLLLPALVLHWSWARGALLWCGFGALTHLLGDGMWSLPETLFWPLLGWEFPSGSSVPRVDTYLLAMFVRIWEHQPLLVLAEAGGAAYLAIFLWRRSRLRLRRLRARAQETLSGGSGAHEPPPTRR